MNTEESIRILLSLYVRIEQNYDAFKFYETYLSEEALLNSDIPERSEHSVDESVIESLWFQIIMQSCAFLEEWDEFLGVKTSDNDKEKIMALKKAVAPARKEIMKWRDIKSFRNEVIAHNMRNSKKEFSLEEMHSYSCPQTSYEIFYLVKFLAEMMNIFKLYYPEEINSIIIRTQETLDKPKKYNVRDFHDLKKSLKSVREQIEFNLTNLIIKG